MRRKRRSQEDNSLFDFIAGRLEQDRYLSVCFTAIVVIGMLLSLVAGLAAWPVVFDLRTAETMLGSLCASIWTTGWLSVVICVAFALLLVLCQRRPLRLLSVLVTNLIVVWVAFMMMLIFRQDILYTLQVGVFTGTLLWVIIAFVAGYILSVLPAMIITLIVGVVHSVADLVLPS